MQGQYILALQEGKKKNGFEKTEQCLLHKFTLRGSTLLAAAAAAIILSTRLPAGNAAFPTLIALQ